MTRFFSIRFKLTASFLVIILAVMVIISIFLYNFLESYYLSNFADTLERSGLLAANFVTGQLTGQVNSLRLSVLAENLSRQSQARVLFLSSDSLVVGDSTRVGGLLNQTLEQEDVLAALKGRLSSSVAFSEKSGQKVMQMAVPVAEDDNLVTGVVFLSSSLEEVYHTLYDIRRFLFISTVLAMAVVGTGSVILARRFTGPIEELTQAAHKMAEGKLDQHIEVRSGDEIGRLAEQFNLMAKRLNYYTSNLKKFVADVAHEVRTPLTTMSLLTGALKDHEMEPAQRREFVDDLDHELERMVALVNDLLELSKLEKEQIALEEIDLGSLLVNILEESHYRFARAGLELAAEFEEADFLVQAAPFQLRQVLVNLLDNALKYTDPGGRVTVALSRENNEAVVMVEDTGSGIPQDDLNFIFERFFRVDQDRSREKGGTGLGLAIVSEIMTRHNGRVWAKSEEGKGSKFFFALPLLNKKDVKKA